MKILLVDSQFPMPDRAAVDVRMAAIVRLLVEDDHACSYFVGDVMAQEKAVGYHAVAAYRAALERLGVIVYERTGLEKVLTNTRFDAVLFKYFYSAEGQIDLVRIWQPWARVVIDSVDLVYARLLAKARLTEDGTHRRDAIETKERELAAYASADMVITVTEDENVQLHSELPGVPLYVIPTIHQISGVSRHETAHPSLVFVGVFSHEPNVDAVLYFASEIWPHILSRIPDVHWTIVGGAPPEKIRALASDNVEVTGHVPETAPYLLRSWVSIAPLRFGAGMKGKIGEAMASGLPVVTTSYGAQGFGITPGTHLFVDDNPLDFALRVVALLESPPLRAQVGAAGRCFIDNRYSPNAVRTQVRNLVATVQGLHPKPTPLRGPKWLLRASRLGLQRHVLWRFQA